jgi:hypothetical protein
MTRIRTWFAVAALATTLAAWPITAAAQDSASAANDPLIIIGWQDDDGGPIYGHASDIRAINQARAQAQSQAQAAAEPDLLAGYVPDCAQ